MEHTIHRERVNALIAFVEKRAGEMGYKKEVNAVFRNATSYEGEAFDKEAYFGYIRPEEDARGAYADFSLVFFPGRDGADCVVALGVGTLGFKSDLNLAMQPWPRRLFNKLRFPGTEDFFFKEQFSDIEHPTGLTRRLKKDDRLSHLSKVIANYEKWLQACQIVHIDDEGEYKVFLSAWLAQYATLRELATNAPARKAIRSALSDLAGLISKKQANRNETTDEYATTKEALFRDHFVVLQGAPGTGKTYTAMRMAQEAFTPDHVFFEQFHAETTFSDFVYGITPKLNSEQLTYEPKKGILYQAIAKAKETTANVLLIVDEINRANLSNVLGPVFFLFEKHSGPRSASFRIGDMELTELPKNLYVLATMNTADRSLAVVDFALRRRFTWITLRPRPLRDNEVPQGKKFHKDSFETFATLFEKYASDEELNLQPGQSYFITDENETMSHRLRYELMPLMKEYFNEGYLDHAKDEFCNYFFDQLGLFLYE